MIYLLGAYVASLIVSCLLVAVLTGVVKVLAGYDPQG